MELYQLDKDDVFALKNAEDISCHSLADGTHYIRAFLRGPYADHDVPQRVYSVREQVAFNRPGPYGDTTRMREVKVSDSRLEDYGNGDDGPIYRDGAYTGFSSPYRRNVWQTIANTIRVGDVLGFLWIRDNNSDSLRQAGFHRDDLLLIVQGPDRTRIRTFNLDSSVGPDNSARMITRNHRLTGEPLTRD